MEQNPKEDSRRSRAPGLAKTQFGRDTAAVFLGVAEAD